MRFHSLMRGLAGAAAVLGVLSFDARAQEQLEAPRLIAADEATPPDNSGRNVRDREDDTLTPMDQGNSDADVKTTQAIRKAIVDNDKLSVNAQNVKIITVDGVVTLRGPVKDAAEKSTIAAAAARAPGVKRVDDQLEIEGAPQNPSPREPVGAGGMNPPDDREKNR